MWASSKEIQAQYKTWQDFLNSEEFDDYLDDEFRNKSESMPVPSTDEEHAQIMYKDNEDLQKRYKDWQEYASSEEFEGHVEKMRDKYAHENQLEGLTFEDIKPYVSTYQDKEGKRVHDVLDKDGNSVAKFDDPVTGSKDAMEYLSKNFNKLRGDAPKISDFMKKFSKKDKDERIDKGMAAQKKDAETNPNWGKDVGPVDPEKDHREISRIMKYENNESLKESRTKIVEAIKAKVDQNAQDIAGVEGEVERIAQLANYQN